MTRDEIMAMDGDALRLAVAKALGWRRVYKGSGFIVSLSPKGEEELLPDWPRDPAAAIDLLESTGCEYNVGKTVYAHMGDNSRLPETLYDCIIWDKGDYEATGDTLALAATRAWLMRESSL